MAKMPDKLITFVIGSACSGKSTLAGYMGRKGHGLTFRSGKFLEGYVSVHHKGKKVSDFVGSDYLIHIPHTDDAHLLCSGILEMLRKSDKVIVDGFPRSLHQMYTLKQYLHDFASFGHTMRVVNLIVPIEELLRRMYVRGRAGDTEARLLAEVDIHRQISRMFKDLAGPAYGNLSFLEFVIPADAEGMKVQRDFTKGMTGRMQEISFIDSVGRRLNDIFCDMEWKRHDHITRLHHHVINL